MPATVSPLNLSIRVPDAERTFRESPEGDRAAKQMQWKALLVAHAVEKLRRALRPSKRQSVSRVTIREELQTIADSRTSLFQSRLRKTFSDIENSILSNAENPEIVLRMVAVIADAEVGLQTHVVENVPSVPESSAESEPRFTLRELWMMTAEWDITNERRCHLINKRIDHGLNVDESTELAQLKRLASARLVLLGAEAPSLPPAFEERVARLKAEGKWKE